MKVFHSSKSFTWGKRKPVVALGNFDGVHLAHQKMFEVSRKLAGRLGGVAVAYTFDPHPVKILSPAAAPPMINTLPQRLELMQQARLDAVVVEPFDLKFAHLGAEEWFEKIILKNLHAAGVVAGYDFTFGTHRSGTVETLEKLALHHGLSCQILEAQMKGEALISSSQIRNFIRQGKVDRAAALLGRLFFLDGEVIAGAGRGAQLGIRTANLKTENELIPAGGVYATRTRVGKRLHPSVTNIGINPTFGGHTLSIESHLLNFRGNLYGKTLRLFFCNRIREEKIFSSAEELIRQIRKDISRAKEILSNE